jgi:hypothetical protein
LELPVQGAERAQTLNLKKAPTESPGVIYAPSLVGTHVKTPKNPSLSRIYHGKKELDDAF